MKLWKTSLYQEVIFQLTLSQTLAIEYKRQNDNGYISIIINSEDIRYATYYSLRPLLPIAP